MKTTIKIIIVCVSALFCNAIFAQSNFTATLPGNQELVVGYGNVAGFTTVNVAADDAGNAYVLSSFSSDSSIWATKYDNNGTQLFNTRVGVLGYETDHKYFAKKIKVYGDRVYVLCITIYYAFPGQEFQTVYIVDKNTGALSSTNGQFITLPGYTSCELVDLIQDGNTIYMAGNIFGCCGPGGTKIQVMKSDLYFTGNIFVLGNDASTDYYLNTESNSVTFHNGSLYMTGVANFGGNQLKILIAKLAEYGIWTEYKYTNSGYTHGAKGLSIAAEGAFIYTSGALRSHSNQPFKTTVIKIDTSLSSPSWVAINRNASWPLFINVSSGNVIYTVSEQIKVIGFSKATGSQLFTKNDFKKNNSIYTYANGTATLSNDQLMIQASISQTVNGSPTQNKVIIKYNTSGTKVYQQGETLSLISPGNPDFAQGLGLAYSAATNYSFDIFVKNTSLGQFSYISGRAAPTALRVMPDDLQNGTDEISSMILFPNPARENFKVKAGQKIIRWTLYDSLMRIAAQAQADANEIEIDCTKLNAGIYFLNASTESGEILTEKIIISGK